MKIVDDLKVPRDAGPIAAVPRSRSRWSESPASTSKGIAVFLIGKGGHQFAVGDMTVETVDLNLRQAQFEVTLVIEEADGQIFGCWQYNRDLFEPSRRSGASTSCSRACSTR